MIVRRGSERLIERRQRERERDKDVTIAASSQIVHGQTALSSPIFGYTCNVCGLRTVACDDAIADERMQNLGLLSVQGGIFIAPYRP